MAAKALSAGAEGRVRRMRHIVSQSMLQGASIQNSHSLTEDGKTRSRCQHGREIRRDHGQSASNLGKVGGAERSREVERCLNDIVNRVDDEVGVLRVGATIG